MIPPIISPVWKRIATGQIKIRSSKLTLGILASNIQRSYQRDPSPENIQKIITTIYDFFVRYDNLYHDELEEIINS